MQDTRHQMKDYLRNYCFSWLNLCWKCNLRKITLTWVTLEKNSNFVTLHSFTYFIFRHIIARPNFVFLTNKCKMSNSQLWFKGSISSFLKPVRYSWEIKVHHFAWFEVLKLVVGSLHKTNMAMLGFGVFRSQLNKHLFLSTLEILYQCEL